MTAQPQTVSPFIAALEQPFGPVLTTTKLPKCPCCGALALAYCDGRYSAWDRIEFDCNCAVTVPDREYHAELQALWRKCGVLPTFVASLPERYRRYTFANFPQHFGVEDAYRVARRLNGKSIFVCGEPGIGKSHLLVATAYEYAKNGRPTYYASATAYVDALRKAYEGNFAAPDLTAYDVVVLDDIDKLRRTDFVFEAVWSLLEHFQTRPSKTLLITSQVEPGAAALRLTPNGDEAQANALASRLASGYLRQMHGMRVGGVELDFRFDAATREEQDG